MGSLSRLYMTNHVATSSSNVAIQRRTRHDEQLTQELNQLKNILVKKDEEINDLKQQMQIVMWHLNLHRDEVPPVPLANPIGDWHNDERYNDSKIADDDDDFLGPF